ncbi:MAG: TrbC/VirB2 family protein [Candidatus Gracilibacteria bacterium]|nr:TrbC/VirB2 family protein [Candidatus Gracilibacteria bacterium]
MKFLLKIFSTILIIFAIFAGGNNTFAGDPDKPSSKEINESKTDTKLSKDNTFKCKGRNCSVSDGALQIRKDVDDIEKDDSLFDYAQSVLSFVLKFIYIIATIYIIYAGFLLLMGTGDIIASGKAKSNIIYVLVGVTIIYLANSIVVWLIKVLGGGT